MVFVLYAWNVRLKAKRTAVSHHRIVHGKLESSLEIFTLQQIIAFFFYSFHAIFQSQMILPLVSVEAEHSQSFFHVPFFLRK